MLNGQCGPTPCPFPWPPGVPPTRQGVVLSWGTQRPDHHTKGRYADFAGPLHTCCRSSVGRAGARRGPVSHVRVMPAALRRLTQRCVLHQWAAAPMPSRCGGIFCARLVALELWQVCSRGVTWANAKPSSIALGLYNEAQTRRSERPSGPGGSDARPLGRGRGIRPSEGTQDGPLPRGIYCLTFYMHFRACDIRF